jgi:hypothetical protein
VVIRSPPATQQLLVGQHLLVVPVALHRLAVRGQQVARRPLAVRLLLVALHLPVGLPPQVARRLPVIPHRPVVWRLLDIQRPLVIPVVVTRVAGASKALPG